MKKVMVLLMIIFCFSAAYSQADMIKEIKHLTLVNDSLQKQVIEPLNDSIVRMNAANNTEIAKLKDQIKVLENDKNGLDKKIKDLEYSVSDLNKNKVKIEKNNLQAKVDSLTFKLTELNQLVAAKDIQITREKQLGEKKSIQEKEKGKQEILNQIIQTYNEPFDALIKYSTIKTVERDLLIVGDNNKTKQQLLNLQKYYNSEQVLGDKYNGQKVNDALDQLGSIDQTELVISLTDKLKKYQLCNDGLKTTIDKIMVIDKRFIANDDYTQNEKLKDILSELAWYFRNYRFNLTNYPYLTEIVLEIFKQKQKDANTDIANLIDKL